MGAKNQPKTPGSGRKPNTPNKATQTLIEKCAKLKCDPFEILLLFANGDWKALGYEEAQKIKGYTQDGSPIYEDRISEELRQKSARDACEYIHPKRKAMELSAADQQGFKVIVCDYTLKKDEPSAPHS